MIAIGLCLVAVTLHQLFWRFVATPTLGGIDFVRCQSTPSSLPYRIGDIYKLRDLDEWFRHTRPCRVSESELDCELEMVSYQGTKVLKISSFGSSSNNEQWAFVYWKGHTRRGSLSELQSILREPTNVANYESTLQPRPTVYYSDTNDDGKLDRKDVPLDTHTSIVWLDINFDGYFDEEFIFNENIGWKGEESKIEVRVPDARNATTESSPLN